MKTVVINANIIFTVSNFRKYLIKELASLGYRVVCIADMDDFSTNAEEILKELGAEFLRIKVSRKGLNPFVELKYMWTLFKVFRKYKPDIILSYTIKPNIFGNFVTRLLKIPTINTVNGLGSSIIKNDLVSKISLFLYRLSFTSSKKVLFQNRDDMNMFIRMKIINEEKAGYVPGSGINPEEFLNCEKEKESEEKIVFLLIARLLRDKGIYEYVEAIRSLKDRSKFDFLLAGTYDSNNPTAIKEEEVSEWEKEGLVNYIGKTDDIRFFFKKCDVVVLPSYREGLSRLLLEAASAKKPIVTTNVPGCRELVRNGQNGYVVEPKSYLSLKETIKKFESISSGELEDMGQKSFEIVSEHFHYLKINEIYKRIIEDNINLYL